MPSIFQNLIIARVVFHEVLRRDDSDKPGAVISAEYMADLGSEGNQTLRERMVNALCSQSHCIEMDISERSHDSVYSHAKAMIAADDDQFIVQSVAIAKKLSQSQISRRIPGGIILIVHGTVNTPAMPFLGIIKAEVHSGFHKKESSNKILAEFLSNLFLTPQQKLYKIGIFVQDKEKFKVYVYDHNMTRAETQQAAKYFYEAFLGCQIAASSSARTHDFFLYTREFINDLNENPDVKMNYQDELYTYLRNEATNVIGTEDFASNHLNTKHRDNYLAYMKTSGFPQTHIVKDLALIKTKLRRRVMRFSSGVRLLRANGNLGEVVSIRSTSIDSTTLVISGRLEDQTT